MEKVINGNGGSSGDQKPLALITGASSGIGLALAKKFAGHGFDIVVAAENPEIAQVQDQIADDVAVSHLQVDLSTHDGVERLYDFVKASGRPVDALAVNAGVGVSGDFIRETDLQEEMNLIDLNIRSVVHLAKRFGKDMVARGGGKILFTSSVAAMAPGPFYAVYAASKAFVQSFAQALRNELQDSGVSVTSLMPGATDTHFFARAGMEDTKAAAGDKDDPDEVAQDGFDALMDGKDHIIAGSFKNKAQGALSKWVPETFGAKMQRQQTEPGSARH